MQSGRSEHGRRVICLPCWHASLAAFALPACASCKTERKCASYKEVVMIYRYEDDELDLGKYPSASSSRRCRSVRCSQSFGSSSSNRSTGFWERTWAGSGRLRARPVVSGLEGGAGGGEGGGRSAQARGMRRAAGRE